jgi:HPt (histidine-containing phosphotransfer) domain-containing protein
MKGGGNGSGLAPAPAAEKERNSRPVDLVHLSRYTLGERALEIELLELFCAQAEACLQRLAAAKAERDWTETAHTLKGSARAIGAWRVGDAAERAESLGGAALAEARAAALGALELAVGEARTYIRTVLQDR